VRGGGFKTLVCEDGIFTANKNIFRGVCIAGEEHFNLVLQFGHFTLDVRAAEFRWNTFNIKVLKENSGA
jgi:hypothetical protein